MPLYCHYKTMRFRQDCIDQVKILHRKEYFTQKVNTCKLSNFYFAFFLKCVIVTTYQKLLPMNQWYLRHRFMLSSEKYYRWLKKVSFEIIFLEIIRACLCFFFAGFAAQRWWRWKLLGKKYFFGRKLGKIGWTWAGLDI